MKDLELIRGDHSYTLKFHCDDDITEINFHSENDAESAHVLADKILNWHYSDAEIVADEEDDFCIAVILDGEDFNAHTEYFSDKWTVREVAEFLQTVLSAKTDEE